MERKALTFNLIAAMLILAFLTTFNIKNVDSANTDYSIERVNHTIQVMYNGYVFLNDTVEINGTVPSGFLIGFPYMYGRHVLQCAAYDATGYLPVSLNAPLENHIGFYGVNITFPRGTPQVFTIGFVFSNNLIVQKSENESRLDFPAYPSLTRKAADCNVSILLPAGSTYVGGTVSNLTYSRQDLPGFTYSPANVTFSITADGMQVIDMKELKREITISGTGEIEGSDTYHLTSKALQQIDSVKVILPENTSNPSVQDSLGRKMEIGETETTNRYQITFRSSLKPEQSVDFTVKYSLPRQEYIEQKGLKSFNIAFPLFGNLDYYIDWSSVTFALPEGARMLSFEDVSVAGSYSTNREVFRETLTLDRRGVFSFDSFSVRISYEYDLLWMSFRPTLWMWAMAIVACTIAFIWKRPRAPIQVTVPTATLRLRSEDVRSFIDSYEEKERVVSEIESLKTRARKGKIPRRRYRVRRKTLETRLNSLSRNLSELAEKISVAGGVYIDLMRRLEVAETAINEIKANIDSIEARHRRGELSLGAYHRLLGDYEERKEEAETTINGILIRLREKIY